jgi:hypothetical protein
MLRRMLKTAIPGALVLFAALSPALLAHHSNANYDAKVEKSMKGTVVDYDWGNPHVLVIWDVTDPSGKVVRWTGDLASVESEQADGLSRHTLKPGDEVIMTVHPAKDGTPYANIIQIRRGDGTMILAVRSQGPKPAAVSKQ